MAVEVGDILEVKRRESLVERRIYLTTEIPSPAEHTELDCITTEIMRTLTIGQYKPANIERTYDRAKRL